MSNSDPTHFEELAALNSVGLLDDAGRQQLYAAAQRDLEIDRLIVEFDETATQLVYDAPAVAPPSGLRYEIMDQLPRRGGKSNVIPFHQWLPYAIAACLMLLGITQATQIGALKKQVASDDINIRQLEASNALADLRLQTLDAKDAKYALSKIMVAWDPDEHRGVVALQDLPTPPAGKDYQLWVLDPGAPAPVSAGVVTASRGFAVQPVSTQTPGFAISLEPAGGQPEPTGPILFAVAPGS